jgi:hypothetical protein
LNLRFSGLSPSSSLAVMATSQMEQAMSTHPRFDPARRCMPEQEWPSSHRKAWLQANTKGDLFDSGERAVAWSPDTRHKNRRGYGRWLTFALRAGFLDPHSAPRELVTLDQVRKYVVASAPTCGGSGVQLRARYASGHQSRRQCAEARRRASGAPHAPIESLGRSWL